MFNSNFKIVIIVNFFECNVNINKECKIKYNIYLNFLNFNDFIFKFFFEWYFSVNIFMFVFGRNA